MMTINLLKCDQMWQRLKSEVLMLLYWGMYEVDSKCP